MEWSEFFEQTGDIDHLARQISVNKTLGLPAPFPCYRSWRPNKRTLPLLKFAINFIGKHERVTVRQVYYALVSAQMLANTQNSYNRVTRILTRARLCGTVPFSRIVDDTREAEKTPSWDSIESVLNVAVEQYRSDWWENQPYYIEVWLEKRALRRIFLPITNTFDVHLCVGGGYQSWPMVWQAKNRFRERIEEEQRAIILYFGDLDPSGKDMPRDIQTRFNLLGINVHVVEVALTRRDIEEYKLPRNPMKPGDSRNRWYIRKYGINYAVELDALPPDVLKQKIEGSIRAYADIDDLNAHIYKDRADKERWRTIIERNNGAEIDE